MAELKASFEEAGFENVVTYLNSGNIIFSANGGDEADISGRIKKMIKDKFDLEIGVFVTDLEHINDALSNAPDWWGTDDKNIYDNLIFVIPPSTAEDVAEKIGEPTEGLEKISIFKNNIFWSFDRNNYSKANWWRKTAKAGIGEMITIRTANTVRKIAESANR
jgi:uncharacterized protein (DUF1697 family)